MGFFKKLFGGAKSAVPAADKHAFYVYVRPKRCDEIIEIRINLMNDLSQSEDSHGYFVRKTGRAIRCPFPVEVYLQFNDKREITSSEVTNGEIVTPDDYRHWQELQALE